MTKLNVISAASKAQTRTVLTIAARITLITDITELAQRMKAAAVRAKAATEDYVAHRMSITVCLEECKEFNDLSDGPDNILALVEALELKEEQRANWFQMAQKLGEDLDAAEKRIAELAGNSPVIPDGYVMVPMRLTAKNDAKGALSGEFSETKFVNCPECFGDDECETCDGSGRIKITVPVSWTTIKEIWTKGVDHFSTAPQEVKGE